MENLLSRLAFVLRLYPFHSHKRSKPEYGKISKFYFESSWNTTSTMWKYCSVAFIWMVTLHDFIHKLKSLNHLVQHNKQYHRKVLLSSFHMNGHTVGFHPQIQKLEPPHKSSLFKRVKKVFVIRSWYSRNTYNPLTFNTVLGCMSAEKNWCVDYRFGLLNTY